MFNFAAAHLLRVIVSSIPRLLANRCAGSSGSFHKNGLACFGRW
jgi:hypothetical protein